jgi:secondary thiamine-phosphate synthase enzyme
MAARQYRTSGVACGEAEPASSIATARSRAQIAAEDDVKMTQETLTVSTRGRGFHDLTASVRRVVAKNGARTGLCTVFVQHTSASLLIQESADPSVLRDLGRWLERLAPEDSSAYEHDAEGPDDMPAHLKSAITRASESIPIVDGALALGTWQAIYLVEHRTAPHTRRVIVHVNGV